MFWAWVSDYLGRARVFMLLYGIQAVVFFLLPHADSAPLFLGAAAAIGLCYGGGFGTMPSFTADFFGAKNMGGIYGWILLAWGAARLSAEHIDLLAGLPATVTLPVRGLGEVLFCHATPRDDEEVVVVDSRLDRWTKVLAGLPEQTMTVVCGHTHMPFVRLAHRRQIINPGSVGMPYGRAGAHWALLTDGAVTLRRTSYDIEAACAAIGEQSDYPDVAEWTDYFLYSRASDADALGAFAPRDGRAP